MSRSRRFFRLILSSALLASAVAAATAGPASAELPSWRSSGPEGGNATVIAVDPADAAVAYAGTSAGLFVSRDGGLSWRVFGDGPKDAVAAIAIAPTDGDVIYTVGSGGAYVTTDRGKTWRDVTPRPGASLTDVVVDPTDPSTVVVSAGIGVFRSIDAGSTWDLMRIPGHAFVGDLAISSSGDTLYAGVSYPCDGCQIGGIVKSSDGGRTWRPLVVPETVAAYDDLVVDPRNADVAYARVVPFSEFVGGVARTLDGGRTWTIVSSGLPSVDPSFAPSVTTLEMDPSRPSRLYATVEGDPRLFVSVDRGDSWAPISGDEALGPFDDLAVAPSDPHVLYAVGSGRDVAVSDDGGSSWRRSNRGFTNTIVTALGVAPSSPDVLYAGTLSRHAVPGEGHVFVSTDRGISWRPTADLVRGSEVVVSAIAVDPNDPSTAYAATEGSGIFKTTDRGASWTKLDGPPEQDVFDIVIRPDDPSILYAATFDSGHGLYRSDDGGATWTLANDGLGTYPHVFDLDIAPTDPLVMYAVSQDSAVSATARMYRTDDGGATWHPTTRLRASILQVEVAPTSADTVFAATDDGVFATTDGGDTWTSRSRGLPHDAITSIAIDPDDAEVLFAGTAGSGVYETFDSGATWSPRNRGLTSLTSYCLAIVPQDRLVYDCSDGGVFVLGV